MKLLELLNQISKFCANLKKWWVIRSELNENHDQSHTNSVLASLFDDFWWCDKVVSTDFLSNICVTQSISIKGMIFDLCLFYKKWKTISHHLYDNWLSIPKNIQEQKVFEIALINSIFSRLLFSKSFFNSF